MDLIKFPSCSAYFIIWHVFFKNYYVFSEIKWYKKMITVQNGSLKAFTDLKIAREIKNELAWNLDDRLFVSFPFVFIDILFPLFIMKWFLIRLWIEKLSLWFWSFISFLVHFWRQTCRWTQFALNEKNSEFLKIVFKIEEITKCHL